MIVAGLQARVSSTRLPGKVLAPILGRPMLARQIERIRRARLIDALVVATSDQPDDDAIERLCQEIGVSCFRGALEDVLDRFYRAVVPARPDFVVRLTGDCPLADPLVIDRCIEFCLEGDFDYASNTLRPGWPDGLDVEVMRFASLETAWREARLHSEREHVAPFIWQRPDRFKLGTLAAQSDLSALRWTVDEPEDLDLIRRIYERLYPVNPEFGTHDILRLLETVPELKTLNADFKRNEGYEKSLAADRDRE